MKGNVVNIEFGSKNCEKTKALLFGLFGWKFGPVDYDCAIAEPESDKERFTKMVSTQGDSLVVYFEIDDLGRGLGVAKFHGCEIVQDTTNLESMGKFAVIKDTSGNIFALWQRE